jgi:hypothetical protein
MNLQKIAFNKVKIKFNASFKENWIKQLININKNLSKFALKT